jgi:hypothetical protein
VLIGTVTAGVLAAAAIDLNGLLATIAVLAFLIVLAVGIVRLRRRTPARNAEMLRSIPAVSAHPSEDAVRPEPIVEPAPDWPSLIEKAETEGDQAALAGFRLAFARAEIARGRNEPAAEQLRSSIRAAAKSRNVSIQAEARLELAELARAAGDLTTACEHWQIARGLFHGLKQQESLGETERLMRQHGCPTDWVLNDF